MEQFSLKLTLYYSSGVLDTECDFHICNGMQELKKK
jgi:hypothetical protein